MKNGDFKSALRALERPANYLKRQLEQLTGKSYAAGVEVSMLGGVEHYYNVAIDVDKST